MTTQSSTEVVLLTVEGRVATLELNRPKVLNAMDVEMIFSIVEKLHEVADSEADILVIKGSGKGFCSGGDIKSMLATAASAGPEDFEKMMNKINEMMETLYKLPLLTISAIHGPAAGLGLSFALASDYVMAEAHSIVAMNFIGIALVPDGGGHFFIERRVGEQKAKEIIWEGEKLPVAKALELGLIDQVVEGNFEEAVQAKVTEWLNKPTKTMLETKNIFKQMHLPTLKNILELEKQAQFKMRQTADHQEGIISFIEKRKPQFTGK
ncbi:enoyl-CoA hydratase [Cytobacillus sp. Hm23]